MLSKIHKKKLSEEEYFNIINPAKRYIDVRVLGNSFKKKINFFLKEYWKTSGYEIYWIGSLKKNEIKKNKIGYRIVRPEKIQDSGVEHTDSYSSNHESFLTVWVPIVGVSKKYTLRYAPGSHLFDHPKNQQAKQSKYNSKKLKKSYVKRFKFVRPEMKIGNVAIHHPNTIHGGSKNGGSLTRVSIEIRIFNKENFSKEKIFNKKYYY